MSGYGPIYLALVKAGHLSAASSLMNAIDTEAEELLSYRGTRKTMQACVAAIAEAAEHYSRDITLALSENTQPDPWCILTNRRYAMAWAIARIMQANDVKVEW